MFRVGVIDGLQTWPQLFTHTHPGPYNAALLLSSESGVCLSRVTEVVGVIVLSVGLREGLTHSPPFLGFCCEN